MEGFSRIPPFLWNKKYEFNQNMPMFNRSILTKKLGPIATKGIIKDIGVEQVKVNGDLKDKIYFLIQPENEQTLLKINEACLFDSKGAEIVRGLWIDLNNENISSVSTIGKVMAHYEVTQLKELLNKEVNLKLNKDNFLVIDCRNLRSGQ